MYCAFRETVLTYATKSQCVLYPVKCENSFEKFKYIGLKMVK